jgi:ankyrin repeat protein
MRCGDTRERIVNSLRDGKPVNHNTCMKIASNCIIQSYINIVVYTTPTRTTDMDAEDDDNIEEQEQLLRHQTRLFVKHVRKNNLPGIESILANGYDINTVNSFGSSMMHLATRWGNLETIECLLANHINFTSIDRQHMTPIMIAASRGDVEIFKLIAAKFKHEGPYNPLRGSNSTFHVTPNGETLLMMACNKPSRHCSPGINDVSILLVDLLIEKGFDPSVVDHKGRTALHYVAQSNRVDAHNTVLKIIRSVPNDAFVHQKDLYGNTALHIACKNDDGNDVVRSLLNHGALVSDTNLNMETSLHVAVRAYDVCGISRLLCQEWGADPFARDNMGRTSIHAAVEDPSSTFSVVKNYDRMWLCLEMLMGICDQRYPSLFLECRDDRGMTPLLLACQQSNHYFASRLIQIPGINFDAEEVDGMTATHFCARRGWKIEIEYLIKLGANINTRNSTGETPLVIVSRLERNGARYRACMTLLIDRVELTETRSAAFAMGLHGRLGRESSTRFIPPELLHALLKLV